MRGECYTECKMQWDQQSSLCDEYQKCWNLCALGSHVAADVDESASGFVASNIVDNNVIISSSVIMHNHSPFMHNCEASSLRQLGLGLY